jgi:hypothetical protein
MKNQRVIQFLFAGTFIALLASCAMFETGQTGVVGTWKNQIGTVWMIKDDGTFDVDLHKSGKREAWGKYTLAGDTMTLWRVGGVKPKGCDGQGVYKFKRDGDNLSFTLVSDKCQLRKKNVLTAWHKQ